MDPHLTRARYLTNQLVADFQTLSAEAKAAREKQRMDTVSDEMQQPKLATRLDRPVNQATPGAVHWTINRVLSFQPFRPLPRTS